MTHIINVYGPSGCGKTRNSDNIAQLFQAEAVYEEYVPMFLSEDYKRIVELSNSPQIDLRIQSHVHFDDIKDIL